MWYEYDRKQLGTLEKDSRLEWLMTNGLGGYVFHPVKGEMFRGHHGLLVASLNPPVNRYMCLMNIETSLIMNSVETEITSSSQSLQRFVYDGVVYYEHLIEGVTVNYRIAPFYKHNAVAIEYSVSALDFPVSLVLKPWFNYREHNDKHDFTAFDCNVEIQDKEIRIITLEQDALQTCLTFSCGEVFKNADEQTEKLAYALDKVNGDPRCESHYRPLKIVVEVNPHETKKIGIVASLGEDVSLAADKIIEDYLRHIDAVLQTAKFKHPTLKRLAVSADQFVVERESTGAQTVMAGYPWFTDWGRDTMIAFEGLLLSTKRFSEAKSVLRSFATYEKNGLIPNMFPDQNQEPLYNTVDASLWFVYAVYKFHQYTKDTKFVKDEMLDTIFRIIDAYKNGTDFSIKMESDGLIAAGTGLDQVTWMDVRINGEVVTPRHGKPVEINALWYNALMIAKFFQKLFGLDCSVYRAMARKTAKAFRRRFWNHGYSCLYDVIDEFDPSIRPNQLYAVSLAFPLIKGIRALKIIRTVNRHLVDVYGIRSLSIYDPKFKPTYVGALEERDHAYHMGTAWGYLYGVYLEALYKALGKGAIARRRVTLEIKRLAKHLESGCLNGYAEIFDGRGGTAGKGCPQQAWSVAEMIRIAKNYGNLERR